MKLRVLVDNNTYIDQYYCGEPALSFYIEDGDEKVLFDVGYSDLLIRNAHQMNVDLSKIQSIVISHGHNDHTRGLSFLLDQYDLSNVSIIAHTDAFREKNEGSLAIGSPILADELSKQCLLKLTKAPLQVSDNLFFLGEIPKYNHFEVRQTLGKTVIYGESVDDYVLDDSALALRTDEGIYVVTGCSHSGVCNIIEHAKVVLGDERVRGVIGGFHLFDVDERLNKTIDYFVRNDIPHIYPCHCVSLSAKAVMYQSVAIHEVGVGLTVNW